MTNFSPIASRSTTYTPKHFQKLAPSMCFQSLVGCLRPTTDSETLSKDPHRVFKLTRGQFSDMNIFISVHTANFVLLELKHPLGIFSQSLRVSGRLKAAYQSLRAYLRQQL